MPFSVKGPLKFPFCERAAVCHTEPYRHPKALPESLLHPPPFLRSRAYASCSFSPLFKVTVAGPRGIAAHTPSTGVLPQSRVAGFIGRLVSRDKACLCPACTRPYPSSPTCSCFSFGSGSSFGSWPGSDSTMATSSFGRTMSSIVGSVPKWVDRLLSSSMNAKEVLRSPNLDRFEGAASTNILMAKIANGGTAESNRFIKMPQYAYTAALFGSRRA